MLISLFSSILMSNVLFIYTSCTVIHKQWRLRVVVPLGVHSNENLPRLGGYHHRILVKQNRKFVVATKHKLQSVHHLVERSLTLFFECPLLFGSGLHNFGFLRRCSLHFWCRCRRNVRCREEWEVKLLTSRGLVITWLGFTLANVSK